MLNMALKKNKLLYSLCHLITRLYNFVPEKPCSAWRLKGSIYVSTPFLFDREVKMTVCNLL